MHFEPIKKLKFRFFVSCILIVLFLALGIFGSKHHEMSKIANLYSSSVRNPLLVGDLKEVRNVLIQSQAVFSGVGITHWQTGKSIEHGNSSLLYIQKTLYFDLNQRNRLATLTFYYNVTASLLAFILSSLAAVVVTIITYYKVRSYLESEINRRQEEERLKTTERVSKQLGHDLRSPLSALNILAATINLSGDQSTMFKEVISRINNLAGDLLEIDRRKSKNQDSLDKDALMGVVRSLAQEKRIEYKSMPVSIDIIDALNQRPGNVSIQADQMKRVLSNLINNSIEALNNKPGNITLTLHQTSNKIIEIAVADDGPGIPSNIIELLNEGRVTTKKNGHGLGISGAKKIVAIHSGSLTIESKPQFGTKVTIELPLVAH